MAKSDRKYLKRMIAFITDVDTGEILACTGCRTRKQPDVEVTFGQYPSPVTAEKKMRNWFDSFVRGCNQGRNLDLSITIKDFDKPIYVEGEIF